MALWANLKKLVDRVAIDESVAQNFREEELRLAAAALLVHAAVIDGRFDGEERRKLKAVLQTRFDDLDSVEVRRLVGEAEAEEREAVDIYRFTSVLCCQLDQEGRKRIIEMLWEVVMADGVVDEFEDNLVWRTAELLGVSTRDRIMLRKAVEARVGR